MTELQKAEQELFDLGQKVAKLRSEQQPIAVQNYVFKTLEGELSLLELFGDKETLFLVHNMGQGCRYCTLWADGFNALVPHIESKFAFAVVSKDSPQIQRALANSRHWRFRMASHGGGNYITEQSITPGENNQPGIVCYIRKGKEIFRKNNALFGPGDQFCAMWPMLSLAGITSMDEWTPQFNYWKRPEKMDDGGANLN